MQRFTLTLTTQGKRITTYPPDGFTAARATYDLWEVFRAMDTPATIDLECDNGRSCTFHTTSSEPAFDIDRLVYVTG